MNYFNFNDITTNRTTNLIPAGIISKVCLRIKKGNFVNPHKNWHDGYPTKNLDTGAVYLNCCYELIGGKYSGVKIWSVIGLYSEKNNNRWGEFGRHFIFNILNSAKRITPDDLSDKATQARKISSFRDLDNLEFVVKIGVKKDATGLPKNTISSIITKGHKDYDAIMNGNISQNIGGTR